MKEFTFGSLFTGVGGFDLGFEQVGMKCMWQCEIDKYCNQVLEKQWKGVKRYTDVREITKENTERPDLICGGFPCQDLSVAGKRKGLGGDRSGLWFEFIRIVEELKPRWVVVENVPGLLSSHKRRDFLVLIQGLEKCGYGVAWRILDSQYFGVAQRRRRVFIVASLGNGSCGEVLFESESLPRDIAKSRIKREEITAATLRGFGHGWQGQRNSTPAVVSGKDKFPTISSSMATKQWIGNQEAFSGDYFIFQRSQLRKSDKLDNIEKSPTLGKGDNEVNVWTPHRIHLDGDRMWNDVSPTSQERMGTGGGQVPCVGVRRLTPTECCRLQSFPIDWNDNVSDTQRYKQMGNAVTVNVIRWLGNRILKYNE